MASEYRKDLVYIQNHFAGIIAETDEGYAFSYNTDYLQREKALSASLTLPLCDTEYRSALNE
jgi:serine/threonine-protein kinase HipA